MPSHKNCLVHIYRGSIALADGTTVPVLGMGSVTIQSSDGPFALGECHFVPELTQPILSVPAITSRGGQVQFSGNRCEIYTKGWEHPICCALKQQNDCFYLRPSQHSARVAGVHGDAPHKSAATLVRWHQRLGDPSWQLLRHYLNNSPPPGVTLTSSDVDT